MIKNLIIQMIKNDSNDQALEICMKIIRFGVYKVFIFPLNLSEASIIMKTRNLLLSIPVTIRMPIYSCFMVHIDSSDEKS